MFLETQSLEQPFFFKKSNCMTLKILYKIIWKSLVLKKNIKKIQDLFSYILSKNYIKKEYVYDSNSPSKNNVNNPSYKLRYFIKNILLYNHKFNCSSMAL